MKPAPHSAWRVILPYLLVAAMVAAAAGVNLLVRAAIGPEYPGFALPFLIAIVMSARLGYIPGLLANALSFTVAPLLFGAKLSGHNVDVPRVVMGVFVSVLVSRMMAFGKTTVRQNEIIAEQNRELSRAVEELRKKTDDVSGAHAALDAVLNAATQTGIVGVDPNGTITLFNTGAEALLGYAAAEVIGTAQLSAFLLGEASGHTTETVGPVQFAELIRPLEDNPFSDRDFILGRRDGTRLIANISLTAQRDTDSARAVRGYVAVIRDITDFRRNEAALIEAMRAAEAAAQSRSDFLATVSHEIRTPLNGVIGMTGLLLETPLLPEQKEFAATIRNSGEALLAIINDILDFSKIEAGKLDLEDIEFDIYTAVEECAEIVAASAHHKGIELVLPVRRPGEGRVRGDQGRVRQILLNLLSNAVKFTPAGRVTTTVDLLSSDEQTILARIAVSDTGIGIPADAQGRLFRAFTQADTSTTRRYGGTGLGLAISKSLVELMGGEIGVSSEPGQGATFWFTARFGVVDSAARSGPALSGKRLLVVTNHAPHGQALQSQLEHHGCVVWVAHDAPEALALLTHLEQPSGFDAVLIDSRIPGAEGLVLSESIRQAAAARDLPVLLLNPQTEISATPFKPLRESLFLRALRSVVSGRTPEEIAGRRVSPADRPELSGTGRILVAEDNPVNQKVVSLMLRKLGYSPEVVANGAEALQALQLSTYHAILMDCQMPEMDGFEATRAIRRGSWDSAATPIIALTANALPGEREKCLAAGMNDYLAKPLTLELLAEKLRQWSPAAVEKP